MSFTTEPTQQLPEVPAPTRTPGAAVAALGVGIAAFLLGWVPLVGLVLGGVGIFLAVRVLTSGAAGRGLAIGGLVLSGLGALFSLLMTVGMLTLLPVGGGSTSEAAATVPGASDAPAVTVTVTPAPETVTVTATPGSGATAADPAAAQVTIPDVVGTNGAIAADTLEAAGLKGILFRSTGADGAVPLYRANWTVVSLEPSAGTTVAADSTVVVTVRRAE